MQNSYTDNLRRILREANDFSVVVEFYRSDAAPPFAPEDAVKRFSSTVDFADSVGDLFGVNYERLVKNFGSFRRTITAETNSGSVDFDNQTREISNYELAGTGFEGLIMVVRLVSRSQSAELSDSFIIFAGKCDKPNKGNKTSMSVAAKHILGGTEIELPRRKLAPEDADGRHPSDILFEGFRFAPQYGVISYSVREKRGGLAGFFGLKKTVTKTLPFSSYSDIDASKFLPEVFGRMQAIGTHLGYADIGTFIRMTTAFCEGEIAAYSNFRSVTPPFYLFAATYLYGKLGGVDEQFPYVENDPNQIVPANGYYSRTAVVFSAVQGTALTVDDPAPDMVATILGRKMAIPNAGGAWQNFDWSDDGAAQTRFVLTDYYKLATAWVHDESFTEVFDFNKEIIFDSSYSDTLFVPSSLAAADYGAQVLANFLRSTACVSLEYFKYLGKETTLEETFFLGPKTENYEPSNLLEPIDPTGPEEPGPTGPGTPEPTANLLFFLRRRYVSNLVLTEQIKAIDFLHQILFPASRMFFSQAADGRLKLNSKKPVDFALAMAALAGASIALDDVSLWIGDKTGQLLIDPHTAQSEVRTVAAANYSLAQNAVSLLASSNITIDYGFAGSPSNGAEIPAQARLSVASVIADCFVSLDGVEIPFTATIGGDTSETIAGFIYGSINGHPILRRKFSADWAPGETRVYIRAKFGTLTLNSALQLTHAAPLNNPTVAPVLTATASGTLSAGAYLVAYSYQNLRGQTLLSPFETVTLSANQKISVGAKALPAGATNINWYCSPAAGSRQLRLVRQNGGAAFIIDSLPKVSAALPGDFNRTGAEVLRAAAVFSDREEIRSDIGRSNVLKGTFEWQPERKSPINQVELTYRDSTQDFRLSRIILRDDAHIKKTGKVSKLEINGQAIDSYHQAYRITSGLLAENRDADFFYKWTADREALLLEEGSVVCITDDSSGVVNFPVRIEQIDFNIDEGFVKATFVARKYSTTLYDDSVAERQIPVIVETGSAAKFADYEETYKYTPSNFTPTRTLNLSTASEGDVANAVATIMDDLQNKRK